jgi:hypothetical protein
MQDRAPAFITWGVLSKNINTNSCYRVLEVSSKCAAFSLFTVRHRALVCITQRPSSPLALITKPVNANTRIAFTVSQSKYNLY